jgi:7,8-dihydropterin-6-yl-methyl-4-(beta-D-ribofuranosyl)aminobenzene 5'-phosphate synthase
MQGTDRSRRAGAMIVRRLAITILVDNRADLPGFGREHGFSLWIEADDRKILFDTGQSDLLLHNAELLGIDPGSADALVLSHGHYDHTGGLCEVLGAGAGAPVYCHPRIFAARFSRQPDGTMKSIGIADEPAKTLRRHIDAVRWVTEPVRISPSIGITGPIPRVNGFEDTGGAFFLDPEGRRPDPVEDDLALWFTTPAGTIVVTGCCHSGIINTIACVTRQTGNPAVYAIIGGLHLLHASPDRLARSCRALEAAGVTGIVSCHCTGESATDYLRAHCPCETIAGAAGLRIAFPAQPFA